VTHFTGLLNADNLNNRHFRDYGGSHYPQGDVTTLGGDVTTLGGDVTTLGGDVTTLGGDVTTLGGVVTTPKLPLIWAELGP
jgi:hypothetical protein